MLELNNGTDLGAGLYPGWSRDRRFQYTLVCKAGWLFEADGTLQPLPEPPAIIEADEYRGEPGRSSLRAAMEIAPFKVGGEFYLTGTVHPPVAGARVAEAGVLLSRPGAKPLHKVVRAYGRRVWKRTVAGFLPTDPEPLEPTPVIYEHAFGGCRGDDDTVFPANPVGMGYNPDVWRVHNLELPLVEQGPTFITSPVHKPPPAALGPLPAQWEPRRSEQGTPVETVADVHGLPVCPWGEDAEAALHNCAPPDQRLDGPFQGGERFELTGFAPAGEAPRSVAFHLPRLAIHAWLLVQGQATRLELVCDTVHVDADRRELYLIYRSGIQWDFLDPRRGAVIVEAAVAEPVAQAPRSVSGEG